MKKNNEMVVMAIALVIIILVGVWIAIVGYYSISNIPDDALIDFNPMSTFLVFISSCIILMFVLSFKRNKKDNNLDDG